MQIQQENIHVPQALYTNAQEFYSLIRH